MTEPATQPLVSSQRTAWEIILKDNSTWLEEMTKLGWRLDLLSPDFDTLYDQGKTIKAGQVYLVLAIETEDIKAVEIPLKKEFFGELEGHVPHGTTGQDIEFIESKIILNVSIYNVMYGQALFADWTKLCDDKDPELCDDKDPVPGQADQTRGRLQAITYGRENAVDVSWFFTGGYLYMVYAVDDKNKNSFLQFRPEGSYDFNKQL